MDVGLLTMPISPADGIGTAHVTATRHAKLCPLIAQLELLHLLVGEALHSGGQHCAVGPQQLNFCKGGMMTGGHAMTEKLGQGLDTLSHSKDSFKAHWLEMLVTNSALSFPSRGPYKNYGPEVSTPINAHS